MKKYAKKIGALSAAAALSLSMAVPASAAGYTVQRGDSLTASFDPPRQGPNLSDPFIPLHAREGGSACRFCDTLQGEPISARIRGTEIPSPWWLRFPAFAAPVAAGLQKADRCPCSASAVSSAGRASASQSLGTKFGAEPRTRGKAARTLSAPNFPVGVPSIRTCRLDGTFLTVWIGQPARLTFLL